MKQEYRKDKCTMNIAMTASMFLILMTGFVVYSYFSDTHEDYNGWIVAATLLMNIGGGIYCLVAVSVKTRELYKKMLNLNSEKGRAKKLQQLFLLKLLVWSFSLFPLLDAV